MPRKHNKQVKKNLGCHGGGISSKNEASALLTDIQPGYWHTPTTIMSSAVTTSSRSDKRRTRSATKAILDFESCLFLRLPKLGRKAMIGMLAGSEVVEFEKACTNKACKKALLEAYEGTEIFGFEFPYELPEYRDDRDYENPDELECAGLEWAEKRGIIAREFTLKLPDDCA